MSAAFELNPNPELAHGRSVGRISVFLIFLGLYLTLRGYHSFDGDQAYRLPILLHQQDARVFSDDPFVRAFDEFNPHRGSLLVLDLLSRPFGLPGALFLLFVACFLATCSGIDRLARAVWPDLQVSVGFIAVGLVLAAKAGNIGTNHLFEAMLLDRLQAFALLGWLALADAVIQPRSRSATLRGTIAITLATLIHPSVGLQLALFLAACWVAWLVYGRSMQTDIRSAGLAILGLIIAVLPGLAFNLGRGGSLQGDMPADTFWLLSVELQSPQHMLPHLWRMPQWLAWSSYLLLAAVALLAGGRSRTEQGTEPNHWPAARRRLTVAIAILLVGLAIAWFAIERWHHVRITVFQPFRMATVARGIALIFVAGRLAHLWSMSGWFGRLRAVVLATAFIGDWLLVMVTLAELCVTTVCGLRSWIKPSGKRNWLDVGAYALALAYGLNFLGHHDTEYGHIPFLASIGVGLLAGYCTEGRFQRLIEWASIANPRTIRRRCATVLILVWTIPALAWVVAVVPGNNRVVRHRLVQTLISRCRFGLTPAEDIERLAFWCREHTPASARFIGPPGPKTFRLWSQRSVAFNRAASPYQAQALADWFTRFQDHVNYRGDPADFVRAYIPDRHGFEARYQRMTDTERADLAHRHAASYVVAAAPGADSLGRNDPNAPLELLHVEGRYAVYEVKPQRVAQRH